MIFARQSSFRLARLIDKKPCGKLGTAYLTGRVGKYIKLPNLLCCR